MYIAGLDLAARPKNPTGFAVIRDNTLIEVELVKDDDEIIDKMVTYFYSVISIDAPLNVKSETSRPCDRLMKRYGAMPLKLNGMKLLAVRGDDLIEQYKLKRSNSENNFRQKIIEVFPTGTSKILKIYERNFNVYRNNLMQLLEAFEIKNSDKIENTRTKHELDAVIAGFTGWLYLKHLTSAIGDKSGKIMVPDIDKIHEQYDENHIKKAVLAR